MFGSSPGHVTAAGGCAVDSGACALPDLLDPPYSVNDLDRQPLDLRDGWPRRWSAKWRVSGREMSCQVQELAGTMPTGSGPVRSFTWRTGQRHRPGLAAMASTGSLHGFESLAERQLLLAADFCGEVTDALSQPFRLRFTTAGGGTTDHIPDFLVQARTGTWLIDVRPASLIKEADRVKFAASAEVALTRGWRYLVVGGWKAHVQSVLDAFSAQRRTIADPLGIQLQLLQAAASGPQSFRALADATSHPVIGRAHALHLLWQRKLAAGLTEPFGDRSLVWIPGAPESR